MQSSIYRSPTRECLLSLKSTTGHLTQVRNHVKKWPWRQNRSNRECYLDNTEKPYTDRFNINEFRKSKFQLKPWQKVVPKEKESKYNSYHWNESYKSDPVEAKSTSKQRFDRFVQSVRDRGSARESTPYNAPEYEVVQERILSLYKSSLLESQDDTSDQTDEQLMDMDLNQSRAIKLSLILKCIEEFNHDMPSSCLNDIEKLSDLVEYYSTSVRGFDPYSALIKKDDILPPNLTLLPEPIRFNLETDELFKGYNALPGIVSQVPGLRGKKRYPVLNQEEFQWPDI